MARAKVPETRRKTRVQTPPPSAGSRRTLDRRWWIAIGVAAIAIVAALVTISILTVAGGEESGSEGSPSAGTEISGAAEVEALFGGLRQSGEALGDADAPVTVVVYEDPQCPACRGFAEQTLPGLVDRYVRPGDVRLEFRGVPIIGPDSKTGLEAVYAAGLQDRLWDFSHVVYLNQGEENSGWLDDDFIRAASSSVQGLDVERLLADRDSAEVEGLLAAASTDAEAIGLEGTPTFQVGRTGEEPGEPVLGGDLNALAELIDPLLE